MSTQSPGPASSSSPTLTVRLTPTTSTSASPLSSSTTATIWPGIARHTMRSLRCLPGPIPSRKATRGTVYHRPARLHKGFDGGDLLGSDMPVPEQRNAVERHLLRDTAYTALCDAIVGGELAPGESLHDQELCAWLGISRTPVRDALARLAEEGLVELAPQRYTKVAPLCAKDAHDMLPVVATLHGLATELAVPRLAREDLQRL